MSISITRVLTPDEYADLIKNRPAGYYSNDRRLFVPGMAFYEPWCFDPTGERERNNQHVMFKLSQRGIHNDFLSIHYWQDWSHIRPPICVVCPNGEWHEIDRKSSNGTGWIVTGELPNITVTPSLVVTGWHGYLTDGKFSDDVEGRGPNGISR